MATRCAVLGDPIGHSLSPVLHRAAYADLGLDWTYDAIRVPSGALEGFLDGLDDTWRGLSLTMPLKRELVPLVDDLSATAQLAAAANTLVLDGEASRTQHRRPGAKAAIRERYDGPIDRATILGGGATATSVGLALAELGCTEITVVSRSAERAAETLRLVAGHRVGHRCDTPRCPEHRGPADLLVSTIPAAAQDDALLTRWADVPVLFDVLYHPWPTPLAAAAEASGRALIGGLDLLVHQAVLQVELFTGHAVPLEVLRSAGSAALAG